MIGDVVPHLRSLYSARNAQDLAQNLELFYSYWEGRNVSFKNYFVRNWGPNGVHPPSKWCIYARPSSVPSGDQLLESWHAKLKHHSSNIVTKKDAIDHVAQLLFNQWDYYWKTLNSEDLMNQYQEKVARDQRKTTNRVTLKDIARPSGTQPQLPPTSQPQHQIPAGQPTLEAPPPQLLIGPASPDQLLISDTPSQPQHQIPAGQPTLEAPSPQLFVSPDQSQSIAPTPARSQVFPPPVLSLL